jgi:putative transposase
MGASHLQVGAAVNMDGSEYQFVQKISGTEWQLRETRTHRILTLTEREILAKYANQTLTVPASGLSSRTLPAKLNLSEEQLETAKVRRLYVLNVLSVPNTRPALERAITEVWQQLRAPSKCPSYTTVYRWKRSYLAANEDIRVLVDNNSAKGNRTSRYSPQVIEMCHTAIQARYLRRERGTIQDALDDASLRIREENERRPAGMALPLPTRRLIRRLVGDIPEIEKHIARFGRESARKHFRASKGHVITNRPLERAEIDHTALDLFVVDESRHLPLGRPYVTACIDDYSRCILGIHVSFTPPSYHTVARCLKDCFRPKSRLQEEYPGIRSEWRAFGVMQELVLDNGLEFHSSSLEQVCYSLGILMRFAARRQAWFKGKIERFFGTLNHGFSHQIPGTTFANIVSKGDYDPAKQAVVTLSALRLNLTKWIADVYHQEHHRGIGRTPAQMWDASINFEDIRIADDSTQLDAIIGRAHQRVLTHKGVEFEGLFYNSRELTHLRQLYGTKLEVEIRVDESNVGAIHVVLPEKSVICSVPCLNPEYAAGLSLWQHKLIKRNQADRPGSEQNDMTWLKEKREIQRNIEEAMLAPRGKGSKRLGRFLEDSRRTSHRGSLPASPQIEGSVESTSGSRLEQVHFAGRPAENNSATSVTTDLHRPVFTPIRKESFFSE